MKNKLLYLIGFVVLNLLFNPLIVNAKEYCHLYLNDQLFDTVTLPFYLYENKREATIQNSSMPVITYSSIENYIDSLTKCELIKKTITYEMVNIFDAYVVDYSYTKYSSEYSIYQAFTNSKIKEDGALLRGYSEFSDEEAPIIKGYEQKYITNVNNPLNLEMLLNNFYVYDDHDGNISDKLKLEYSEYETYKNTPGNYPVIISAIDSASNKSSITFYIETIDTEPPLISGTNEYISHISSPITIEETIDNLIVTDNVDKNLSSQLFLCHDSYSNNKFKVGTYYIAVCVYDKSENLSNDFKIKIEVKDDISPKIEGLATFNSYTSNPLTIEDIMYSLAASKNGKDISNSLFIEKDHYSNYQNTLGEKFIYFQAMDEYNNISESFKVTINFIDDIAPQIFGLDTYISYLSNPLSLTYLKQQLTFIDNFDLNVLQNIEIIDDTYSNNLNKIGTYFITLQTKDNSNNISSPFKIKITTIDDVPPYINGPSQLKYSLKEKPSLEQILFEFSAKDNVSQNLKIEISNDTYSSSIETGVYYLDLFCIDSSDNKSAPFKVKIDIVGSIANLKEISLYAPTQSLLTIDEINTLISMDSTYKIIQDTYTPNYSIEGSYLIEYALEDNSIVLLHVKTFITPSQKEIKSQQKKETFLSKLKSFFNKIKSFFLNLWSKINLSYISLYYQQLNFYFENRH